MSQKLDFYRGKKVLITGHTGFKGTWMCSVLLNAGAEVKGYALEPPTNPSLFSLTEMQNSVESFIGDIRDLDHMMNVFRDAKPDVVIHMAAQPLVRESYIRPVETYSTNVMGTVNVLECIRQNPSIRSFVNVTTDKVYRNLEQQKGYVETDVLDGYDPYSNSKSCSELVTASYVRSFFSSDSDKCKRQDGSYIAVTTARAGNVIGGGDFATDRIVPDCVRAGMDHKDIVVRNPHSTRPYQHVLEPVAAYLMMAAEQYDHPGVAGNYNVGPDDIDCRTTGELVDLFCDSWNTQVSKRSMSGLSSVKWINQWDGGPHEANLLKLDCSKIKRVFGWAPHWHVEEAIDKTVEWSMAYALHEDLTEVMERQIIEYFK